MNKLGKIRQHHRKEHLNIAKIAKFEKDMSTAREYIALKIYRRLYGGGQVCAPHQTKTTLRSCIFISFQQITYKLGSFTNLRALFPVLLMDLP